MNFFQEFRIETKLLLVVALIAVVLAVAGILLLQVVLGPSSPTLVPLPQTTEKELTTDERNIFFDFPSVNLTTSQYGVYVSYPDRKQFSLLEVFRDDKKIKSLSSDSVTDEFLEHVPPGKYTYEVVFHSEGFKNGDDFLRQSYEIEVTSIPPEITSIIISQYKGYLAAATITVQDASSCKAGLLLYPPPGYERSGPTTLKSHEFRVGDGLDYFGSHQEFLFWDKVLFPELVDFDLKNYDMDVKVTCRDYYDFVVVEKTEKFQTIESVSPEALTISYHKDPSGLINGQVTSRVWVDLDCRLLIGDQSNYTLDEKNFALQGRHVYEFDVGRYNKNFLYVTAICEDREGRGVTKISAYQAE